MRTRHNHRSYDNTIVVHGHFYPNAGGAIATQKITGGTFAATAAGTFTFTFSEIVRSGGYWYPMVKLHMGVPGDSYAMVTALSQAASGIITVTIKTFGAAHNAVDVAADASNVVTFNMKVQYAGP